MRIERCHLVSTRITIVYARYHTKFSDEPHRTVLHSSMMIEHRPTL